jgi:hypothetical protein
VYPIKSDAPKGWLLVDLLYEQLCTQYETLTLQRTENSEYFAVENFSVISNGSLQRIEGVELMLDVLASRPPYQRVLTISAKVENL